MGKEVNKIALLFLASLAFFSLLSAGSKVYVMPLEGAISPVSDEFLADGLERAEEDSAECLVILLDTPGGLMKSMHNMVKRILGAPIPVIVYIYPAGSRAGSAGVFITYAAHRAVMAPGTNIGAAHPVSIGMGGTGDTSSVTMMEKATNDAVAFIRSLAEKRGRNVEWAEKSVRQSASVSAEEALRLGVVDAVLPDTDSLLSYLDGQVIKMDGRQKKMSTAGAEQIVFRKNWRYKLLDAISDPNIAYILLLIGIYGIFFELYNPGAIFPGVVGGISLILAFYALHTLPTNYAGLLLILFSLVLFIAEIKITSYGMLTVGGIISFVFGSIMLFKTSIPVLQVSWKLIGFATALTALFFLVALGLGLKAQRRKTVTGREGLVGEKGIAISAFRDGSGQVKLHGEIWKAVSSEELRKGDEVVVEGIEGLVLKVKKHTDRR
ncbi:MAG: nodulation protein NfeD [Calditrichia bacterium]